MKQVSFYSEMKSSSVQSVSHVQLFATPWTAACQASLSNTNSRSPPKSMSTESGMPPISWHTVHLLTWGVHLSVSYFLPFHTVHGILKARILKWFAIPFSSGPHSVRPLHHPGWLHMAWLSFTELNKAVVHVIRFACCL